MEETKKNNNILYIIIIILLLIIIAGILLYFLVLTKKETTSDTNNSINTTEQTTTVKREVYPVESDMLDKMNNAISFYETSYISRRIEDLYKKDYYKLEDKDLKLNITLLNAKVYDYDNGKSILEAYYSKEKKVSANGQRLFNQNIDYSIIKEDDVKKIYNEMFKDDYLDNSARDIGFYDSYTNCPSYVYDSNNKVYIRFAACGGDSGITDLTYNYQSEKETIDGTEYYYAYVAVGYVLFLDGSNYELHYSYMDESKKENISSVEYKIDESNYNKFDKFKYVFVKDSKTGNLFVDHIEIVK